MIELLVFGAVGLAIAMVVGLVMSFVGALLWLVLLPFKLLGWALKGAACVALLPIALLILLPIGLAVGAVALVFALPILPLIAFVWLIVWLARRGRPRGVTA